MTVPLKMLTKAVVERRRLYLDYDCWLATAETLTDFEAAVEPYTEAGPLTVDTSYPDAANKRLMVFVSGGIANTDYRLSMLVRTSDGQVKRDDLGLRVTP